MQPGTQHTPSHPAPERPPREQAGTAGGVRPSAHHLPCIKARQICFLQHYRLYSHLSIKDALVTLCSHALLWAGHSWERTPQAAYFSIHEAAGWLHSQHRSSTVSLHPGLLAGCSSQQLATGSLSHSTASFCTEKDLVQTMLQPRRVFLLPSTCLGHSCMGCDPASNQTNPCMLGSQVLAPQVPPQPQVLMSFSLSACTMPLMHQEPSAPQGRVALLWV